MTLPLIGADQDFAIWAALIGLSAFGFWSERYPIGKKYSGVMLLITAAIILSNLKIIPTAAPVYDLVWDYLVPIAIPLLLFQADIRRIFREAGKTLIAFIIGSAAVVAGVMVGIALLNLGESEAELAGVFAGTYIGGSLNFAAVAEASGFQSSSLLTAAVAADNVATNLHLLIIISLPGLAWVSRHFQIHRTEASATVDDSPENRPHVIRELDIVGLLAALALAFLIAASGKVIAALIDKPQYAILFITLLALAIGTFLPGLVARLSGFTEAGNVLMFMFLAAIGASADIWLLIEMAPVLFLFAVIIISIHLLVLFPLGKLFKLDLGEMIMASAVCIGGPASAPAIASAKGWKDLLIPGVLAGSFGYAIGSFIGVTIVEWLR